jgi:hypothetical protein
LNKPHPERAPLDQFVSFSSALTGFDATELWGTGMVETYYALLPTIVGDRVFGRLMTQWYNTWFRGDGDERRLHDLVKEQVFDDPEYGPLAVNLAALWYTGQWNQLPAEWCDAHGASAADETRIISPAAYTEGLVWKAMHTHPPAAKQPGYGSWALKPETEAAR